MAEGLLGGSALVIGAGSGLGRDIAITLASRGVSFIICADVNAPAAAETVQMIQKYSFVFTHVLTVDVTDETHVSYTFGQALSKCPNGRLDYFVNCAGTASGEIRTIADMSLRDFRKMDEVHNVGSFLVMREAIRIMQKQDLKEMPMPSTTSKSKVRSLSRGSIVIMSSIAARGGVHGTGPYVAAKHAVEGLVKTAALECARSGIRINAVAPTYVAGPNMDVFLDSMPGLRESLLNDHPMGRLVEPAEVSDAVCFLLSASASYLTGVCLSVDGGLSCHPVHALSTFSANS